MTKSSSEAPPRRSLFHFKFEGQPQGTWIWYPKRYVGQVLSSPSIFVQAGRYMFISTAILYIKITGCIYCRLTSIEFTSNVKPVEQNSYILYTTADCDQAPRYKFMSIIMSSVDTPLMAEPCLGPPRLSTSLLVCLLRNRNPEI